MSIANLCPRQIAGFQLLRFGQRIVYFDSTLSEL